MEIIKFWGGEVPTYTARLNVREQDFEQAMDPSFWPENVLVREWEHRDRFHGNSRQNKQSSW